MGLTPGRWKKAACSNGSCLEVGYFKSTKSGRNECVEVGTCKCPQPGVYIRDSKDPDGPVLGPFTPQAFADLCASAVEWSINPPAKVGA